MEIAAIELTKHNLNLKKNQCVNNERYNVSIEKVLRHDKKWKSTVYT